MTKQLCDELKKELLEDYFLVRRGAFWGSFLGVLAAVGIVSFSSAKAAITTWAKAPILQKLDQAEKKQIC